MNPSYMQACLNLALKGRGQAAPNPLVGAVVVRHDHIIGQGAHLVFGQAHAEPQALAQAGSLAQGADLYVNLEPCSHYGRQPPCTEAILAAGIRRVFIGSLDPDPRVAGQGASFLREAGLDVTVGLMHKACLRLNEAYFHHKRTGLPFLTYKYAMTLDGQQKTGLETSDPASRQLSGPKAFRYVHLLRLRHQAIMIGAGTLRADDPRLSQRSGLKDDVQPLRIVLGSHPGDFHGSQILATAKSIPTLFITTAALEACRPLQEAGVQVWTYPGPRLPLGRILEDLGAQGLQSILLEGGAQTAQAFLQEGLIQRVVALIAPTLWAQAPMPAPASDQGSLSFAKAIAIDDITLLGSDLRVQGRL